MVNQERIDVVPDVGLLGLHGLQELIEGAEYVGESGRLVALGPHPPPGFFRLFSIFLL